MGPNKSAKNKPSDPMMMPLVKAALVHLALLAVMMVSFQSHQKAEDVEAKVSPPPIQAKAISSKEVERLVKKKQDKANQAKRAEQQRKRKIRENKEKKRKAALDKKRKADKEKKRQADLQKKREADDKAKKLKAEKDRQKKLADEAKRKREAEAKRNADLQAEKQRAANERRTLTELQKYTALIKSKISRNWIIGGQTGRCKLEVRLASSGLILDVRELGGDAAICRSAIAAVRKSDPLPVSKDSAVFNRMRVLNLDLDPQDK